MRRAEGGAKIVGVFLWKITILRQKNIFFPILGGRAPGAPPPWNRPCILQVVLLPKSQCFFSDSQRSFPQMTQSPSFTSVWYYILLNLFLSWICMTYFPLNFKQQSIESVIGGGNCGIQWILPGCDKSLIKLHCTTLYVIAWEDHFDRG